MQAPRLWAAVSSDCLVDFQRPVMRDSRNTAAHWTLQGLRLQWPCTCCSWCSAGMTRLPRTSSRTERRD